MEPPLGRSSVPASTWMAPALLRMHPEKVTVTLPALVKVPLLTKVLLELLALKTLFPEGPALKVPLLVKVTGSPLKPARLPLVQLAVPLLVMLRLNPSVPPSRVAVAEPP